jgi:hypothetical protein
MKAVKSTDRGDTLPGPPPSLPVLGRGAHLRPEWGACLMEYVSVLAGERFGDAPRCTHPALAALARRVNDRMDDEAARTRLGLLAPHLIGTRRVDRRITETVVVACLEEAAASGPLSRSAARRLLVARTRLSSPHRAGGARRWACWVREVVRPPASTVRWAFDQMVGQWPLRQGPDQDRRLDALLARALADCRALDATPEPAPAVRTG